MAGKLAISFFSTIDPHQAPEGVGGIKKMMSKFSSYNGLKV